MARKKRVFLGIRAGAFTPPKITAYPKTVSHVFEPALSSTRVRRASATQAIDIGVSIPGQRIAELGLEIVLEMIKGQTPAQREKMWDWYIADTEKFRAWIERVFTPTT